MHGVGCMVRMLSCLVGSINTVQKLRLALFCRASMFAAIKRWWTGSANRKREREDVNEELKTQWNEVKKLRVVTEILAERVERLERAERESLVGSTYTKELLKISTERDQT